MSRGGYTNAIDMWSAGCIFGELLQRVTYVGSAATPQLQVAYLSIWVFVLCTYCRMFHSETCKGGRRGKQGLSEAERDVLVVPQRWRRCLPSTACQRRLLQGAFSMSDYFAQPAWLAALVLCVHVGLPALPHLTASRPFTNAPSHSVSSLSKRIHGFHKHL